MHTLLNDVGLCDNGKVISLDKCDIFLQLILINDIISLNNVVNKNISPHCVQQLLIM